VSAGKAESMTPDNKPQTKIAAEGLATIPSPAQRDLVERIAAVLWTDERIFAVWLGGSLARGNADAYSDVDVHALVDDHGLTDVLGRLDRMVDQISPTVYRRRMTLGRDSILVGITPEWQRFDLVFHSSSSLADRTFPQIKLLWARENAQAWLPRVAPQAVVTNEQVAQFAPTVPEFLRVLGLLPVVVGRGEYLVAMDGVMLLRRYLIDLFILANGIAERGGILRLHPLLTSEQRAALERFPPLVPDKEAVITGHLACARLFLPLARRVLERNGVAYPIAFEQATLDHLKRTLNLTLSAAPNPTGN
jgi:predicted nucleotidyltransferase